MRINRKLAYELLMQPLTKREIAQKLGCGIDSINHIRRELNILPRSWVQDDYFSVKYAKQREHYLKVKEKLKNNGFVDKRELTRREWESLTSPIAFVPPTFTIRLNFSSRSGNATPRAFNLLDFFGYVPQDTSFVVLDENRYRDWFKTEVITKLVDDFHKKNPIPDRQLKAAFTHYIRELLPSYDERDYINNKDRMKLKTARKLMLRKCPLCDKTTRKLTRHMRLIHSSVKRTRGRLRNGQWKGSWMGQWFYIIGNKRIAVPAILKEKDSKPRLEIIVREHR